MVSEDPSAEGQSAFDYLMETSTQPPRRPEVPERAPAKRNLKSRLSPSDLTFRAIARGGGSVVLIIMILVGTFLGFRAAQALHKGWSFLTTQTWNPNGGGFGIAALVVGTALIALVAIVVAVPLSVGTALYISEYAPRRIQRLMVSAIDLMAAVPSIIFGLWGFVLLQ